MDVNKLFAQGAVLCLEVEAADATGVAVVLQASGSGFRIHVRKDKNSLSLELSSERNNRFQDVRPTSGRMPFAQSLLTTISL